ncbi:hypothetical protein FB451DRAFT_1380898 [Mycena latifolia]|nr:hypothetical protein FB451DRAFT_1380898 [Mycena latifolia]
MHCTSFLAIFYPPLLDFAVFFLEFASAFHCALVPGGTDCSGVRGFINGLLSCTWALTFALSALKQVVSTSRHLDSVEAESGSKYGGGAPRTGLGGGGGVLGDETPSWSSTTPDFATTSETGDANGATDNGIGTGQVAFTGCIVGEGGEASKDSEYVPRGG